MERGRFFYSDPTAYAGMANAENSKRSPGRGHQGDRHMTTDELRALPPDQRLSLIDRNKHWFSTPVRVALTYDARQEKKRIMRRRR